MVTQAQLGCVGPCCLTGKVANSGDAAIFCNANILFRYSLDHSEAVTGVACTQPPVVALNGLKLAFPALISQSWSRSPIVRTQATLAELGCFRM